MTEKTVPTHLSDEDKQLIANAKSNLAYLKLAAEKAAAEAQAGELSLRNMVLTAFMKYGLSTQDQIEADGRIVRVSVESVSEEEVAKSTVKRGAK